ncbi:hypothetical protein P691DRAFT_812624 [Macrolepiota fuliginosa MF-IS2]|uniref:Wax synthase domain-containing protein n=1 Tax=Macrolepiota fuliginosa MF-IS2 TaxID=1400762 RepID=A0A9P5XDF9_9AGAR|nr:hypothetical protein P691DRAFT_812624 [Macrolepiota fuliginosa MF-IS2]
MLLLDIITSLVISIFGLAVFPHSKLLRRTCGIILVAHYINVLWRPYPADALKFFIYESACFLGIALFIYSDRAILNDAYLNHKRSGQTLPLAEMTLLQRVRWSTDAFLNLRGINWSWEIPHLRRSTLSRWGFVGYQLLQLLGCVAINGISKYPLKGNPVWQPDRKEGFRSGGFVTQTYNVMVFWVLAWSSQLSLYILVSTATVALGFYEPKDWPSLFGPWSSLTSMRKFWGQYWHQLLRRPFQAHGKFVTDKVLGLSPGSKISSYIQLYIAFFLSGLFHAGADWAATKTFQNSRSTFMFYILQAVVITFEDGVIALGRVAGVYQIPSVISYVWVLFWVSMLGPMWIEGMVKGRLLQLFI